MSAEENKRKEFMQLYAPRCPMTQLPKRYRVTKKNPDPPLLHFAFPNINDDALYTYAEKILRIHYNFHDHIPPSPTTLLAAADHLSGYVEYELDVAFPFRVTSDCSSIITLYTNYTMEGKRLIEEDEEDVIRMVQKVLGYDKSVRPKWYFDLDDPWQLGDD